MRGLYRKLKSRAGESLAEVLIALLVSTVAIMMLAAMISASVDIIKTTQKTMDDYYGGEGTPGTVDVSITFGNEQDNEQSIEQLEAVKEISSTMIELGNTEIISYAPAA